MSDNEANENTLDENKLIHQRREKLNEYDSRELPFPMIFVAQLLLMICIWNMTRKVKRR